MQSHSTFVRVFMALFFLQAFVQGFPANISNIDARDISNIEVGDIPDIEDSGAATVPCDPISKYDRDYFVAHICHRPKPTTCLFYTFGLSKTARIFATANGAAMTTIWQIWPPSYYNKKQVKSNRMRCIFADPAKTRQYFIYMSGAMAYVCDEFATVLTPDPKNVPMTGLWGRIEFPQIEESHNAGKVNKVEAINPDGSDVQPFWKRGSQRRNAPNSTSDEFGSSDDFDVPNIYDDDVNMLHDDFDDGYDRVLEERATCGVGPSVAAIFDKGGSDPIHW